MSAVSIEGNLTRDPELRFTPTGRPVVSFSVAENRRWTDNSGQQQEETSFFDCEAWQSLGENISESFRKGQRVLVIGRLRQESWEAEDGTKRSRVKVVVSAAGHSLQFGTSVQTDIKKGASVAAPVMAGAGIEDPF